MASLKRSSAFRNSREHPALAYRAISTAADGRSSAAVTGDLTLMHVNKLRKGVIALTKPEPADLDRAECCFRQALDVLADTVGGTSPKVSLALDRIGLACQLRGRDAFAEKYYTRSLTCRSFHRLAPVVGDLTAHSSRGASVN
jgi:hypothetical protein